MNGAGSDPDSAVPPAEPRVWRAGTLVYTQAGLLGLFFWLLWGDFAWFLKERSVPVMVQLMLHRFHVSDLLVGTLTGSLPTAIACLVVPAVSQASDRHRGRWGRRIPFLAAPIPFTLVAMAGMAFSPEIGRAIHRFLGAGAPAEATCAIGALAASWALFELCAGICYAMFLALIADVVPREVMGRFFALFRVVSLVAGIAYNLWILGNAELHYEAILLGLGAVYFIGFTAMSLKVKEGDYPPPEESAPEAKSGPFFARVARDAAEYCRACFTLPYYRWIFLSTLLYRLAMVPLDLFVVFYAKSLNMSMARLGEYGAAQLFLSLLQAYPIGWLADRFHPLRMTILSVFLLVISVFAAFFLVHDARSFGIAYVLCGTLTGAWATSSAPLPAVLFAKPRFAILNSAWLMSIALGATIAGPACGWLLDLRQHAYIYTFLWAGVVGLGALGSLLVVYRKFCDYGGAKRYVAPG